MHGVFLTICGYLITRGGRELFCLFGPWMPVLEEPFMRPREVLLFNLQPCCYVSSLLCPLTFMAESTMQWNVCLVGPIRYHSLSYANAKQILSLQG